MLSSVMPLAGYADTPVRIGDDEIGSEQLLISNVVSIEEVPVRIEGMQAEITVVHATAPATVTLARTTHVYHNYYDGQDFFHGHGYPIRQMTLPYGATLLDYIHDYDNWPRYVNATFENVPLTTGQLIPAPEDMNRPYLFQVRAGSTTVLEEGIYSVNWFGSFGARIVYIVVGDEVVQQPTPSTESSQILRFAIDSTTFTNNGVNSTLEAAPFIANDRTMVPLRVIIEAFGVEPQFDEGVISFTLGGANHTMTVGQPLPNNMGTPVIVADRTFVPLIFVVEALDGANARWDSNARAAYVYIH